MKQKPRKRSVTTRALEIRFSIDFGLSKYNIVVPKGTRVVDLAGPSGPRWVVDDVPAIKFQSESDQWMNAPNSMFRHDAEHYGVVVPTDAVHQEPEPVVEPLVLPSVSYGVRWDQKTDKHYLLKDRQQVCELTPAVIQGLGHIDIIREKLEDVLMQLRGTKPKDTPDITVCQVLNMLGWKD